MRWLGPQQVPFWPERYLTNPAYVARLLRAWSGPGWPGEEEIERYAAAARIPFVAHSAAEYYRWLVRSQPRRDGRRFREGIEDPITVPVLQLHGSLDPLVLPETAAGSQRFVTAAYEFDLLHGAGHFLPEERPAQVSALLVDWLRAPAEPRGSGARRQPESELRPGPVRLASDGGPASIASGRAPPPGGGGSRRAAWSPR